MLNHSTVLADVVGFRAKQDLLIAHFPIQVPLVWKSSPSCRSLGAENRFIKPTMKHPAPPVES
jgi:hypothetical protein